MCARDTTESAPDAAGSAGTPHAEAAAAALARSPRHWLTAERWRHTLSVAETAFRIAEALDWPPAERNRALLAALFHDAAKDLPPDRQRELAALSPAAPQAGGPTASGPLLHAHAGAALAEREYGIRDREVLEAVAFHPTGAPHATPLLQLLFAADYLEPTRANRDAEDRELLGSALAGETSLEDVFCGVMRRKLASMLRRGMPLHPLGIAAWNERCGRRA